MSKNINTFAAGLLALTSIAAASVGCQPQASEQTAANPTEFVEQTETVDATETEAASTFELTEEPTEEPTAEPVETPAEPTAAPTAEPTAEPTEEPVEERFVTTGYGRVKFTKKTEEFFIEIKRRKIDLRKNFNDEKINVDDINLPKTEIYDTQTGIVLICEDYFFIEGLGWTRESVSIYDNRVLIGSSDGRCYLYDKEGLKEKKIGSGKVTTLEDSFVYNHECIWYNEVFG